MNHLKMWRYDRWGTSLHVCRAGFQLLAPASWEIDTRFITQIRQWSILRSRDHISGPLPISYAHGAKNADMLIVLLPLPPHAERLAARAAAAPMPAPPPTAAVHAKERTLDMQNSRHTHMQNTEQLWWCTWARTCARAIPTCRTRTRTCTRSACSTARPRSPPAPSRPAPRAVVLLPC